MLTIYYSNQIEVLKDILGELLTRTPPKNPLTSEQILVQSTGMSKWLQLELAQQTGIAIALDFPFPASFLWSIYTHFLPHVPKKSVFYKEALTWKIMTLLYDYRYQSEFQTLSHYLTDDPHQLKCYQLATKIADIFDQYLVYRPDWITKWEAGDNLSEVTRFQPWQPILWRAIIKNALQLKQAHRHRVTLHNEFKYAIENTTKTKGLPKRIFIFGMTAFAPHFIETVQLLKKHLDIHLMMHNPCRQYWADLTKNIDQDDSYTIFSDATTIKPSTANNILKNKEKKQQLAKNNFSNNVYYNSLLASLGQSGSECLQQILNTHCQEINAFVTINAHSLLTQMQSDILNLHNWQTNKEKPKINPKDHSISFHNCPSPRRELEILHDQLLALFDQVSALTPKDIIVMIPDIETYAPWINSVFGQINDYDKRKIPFSISDCNTNQTHPIMVGILQLLNLHKSRYNSTELLTLLDIPALQRQFNLQPQQLKMLRTWIYDSGIRWGISEDDSDKYDIPRCTNHSWRYGVSRMLLGYCLPESSGSYQNILPFNLPYEQNIELVGYISDFIEQIENLKNTLEKNRTYAEWCCYIHNVINLFFKPDSQDEQDLQVIYQALTQIQDVLTDVAYNNSISHVLFMQTLLEQLNKEQSTQRFLTGKVNFCTLTPMRTIPFKVICLLGMNNDTYPRMPTPIAFDLMIQNRRAGDRFTRDDDRYLFLEIILSARHTLYLSYIGRNINDNSETPPSTLVSELLEYCQNNYHITHNLTTMHPLHACHPDYFSDISSLPILSYAHEWLPIAKHNCNQTDISPVTQVTNKKPENIREHNTIKIKDLISFYQNTCRYYFKHKLKVFFSSHHQEQSNTELFLPTSLTSYKVKEILLKHMMNGTKEHELYQKLETSCLIPHKPFGEILIKKYLQDIKQISNKLEPYLSGYYENIIIKLPIGGVSVQGYLKTCNSDHIIGTVPASIKAKHIINHWISHLCFCANAKQNNCKTHLIGFANTKDQSYEYKYFSPVSRDIAQHTLENLIRLYLSGLNSPIPFFPETAWAWYNAQSQKNEEDVIIKTTCDKFYGTQTQFQNFSDSADPYIQRLYPKLEDHYEHMTVIAHQILPTLFEHLTEENTK